MPAPALIRQLEMTRFERAMEVVESVADHRALLTTAELERLNNILTGKKEDTAPPATDAEGPWRQEPVTLTLPSGKTETLSIIADPKLSAREKLHRATELAEGGHVIDAAVNIYAGMVLAHPFKDANRRTAVLAAHYFLRRYGSPVSGIALHEIGLGDLRQPGQIEALKDTIRQMAEFAAKRQRRE